MTIPPHRDIKVKIEDGVKYFCDLGSNKHPIPPHRKVKIEQEFSALALNDDQSGTDEAGSQV